MHHKQVVQYLCTGVNGYNNGVKLLDDVCSTIYGSSKGTAKSVKIEDITGRISGFSDSWVRTNTTHTSYGTWPYTITAYRTYPNIWSSEVGAIINGVNQNGTLGLSQQNTFITGTTTATTSISPKYTVWDKSMATTHFTNSIYYTLFINNGVSDLLYWVASRSANSLTLSMTFGVDVVGETLITAQGMYRSDGATDGHGYPVRPVVSLTSNVQITGGAGTTGNPWTIE